MIIIVTLGTYIHKDLTDLTFMTDCVTSASDIASRQRLRSASRHQLLVPRYQLSSLCRLSLICCRWTDDLEFAVG